ncbi:FG-GAP repeat domain-containing protein [Spirosoma fluminis]
MKHSVHWLTVAAFSVALTSSAPKPVQFADVTQTNLPLLDLISNSMDVEPLDIDNDGDLDLIIASEFRPNVILINDGKGVFTNGTAGRLTAKNHDHEDIALGDFDRDGDTDIIFVSEDDKVHEYHLNDGKGVFKDVSDQFPVQCISNAVVAGDFDKDGDLDLIMGNDGQDYFLANDGKGKFTNETAARLPEDKDVTQDVEAADIDKDGDLDLIFGNEDDNKLYLNNGKGIFTNATAGRLPIQAGAEETRKVDLADVDNDGDLDIHFSNVNFRKTKNPANRLLINNGKGVFIDETARRYQAVNNLNTADAQFVDLDNDKDLDLILANVFGAGPQALLNDGKGVFTEQTKQLLPEGAGKEAIAVEVADLNKDGLPDIYFGVFRDADALLLSKK